MWEARPRGESQVFLTDLPQVALTEILTLAVSPTFDGFTRSLQQAQFESFKYCTGTVAHTHFREYIRYVILHRAFGHTQ
jgi:hypothetical protein